MTSISLDKRERNPHDPTNYRAACLSTCHSYAATRRQHAATACLFLTGAALIAFANIEPQRAKAAERRKVLEAFIARKRAAVDGGVGGDSPYPQPDPPKS